jgi:hypothetical protein
MANTTYNQLLGSVREALLESVEKIQFLEQPLKKDESRERRKPLNLEAKLWILWAFV